MFIPDLVTHDPTRYVCEFCAGELVLCSGCLRAVHEYERLADGTGCWRCASLTAEQRADFARLILAEYTGHAEAPRTEDVTA